MFPIAGSSLHVFLGRAARELGRPDAAEHFERALRDDPGTWVRIDEEDGGNLRARLDGDEVRIEGSGEDGSLDIRFPAAFGDALFGEAGDDPDLGAAIRSLADHEEVLISIDGDDGRVRVWIEPR